MSTHADRSATLRGERVDRSTAGPGGARTPDSATLGNQHLQQAITALTAAGCHEAEAGPWQGPHAALFAIAQARAMLDQAESTARQELGTVAIDLPIGQRVPAPAEVDAARCGTEWTFRYPDNNGHLTVMKDAARRWTAYLTDYSIHRERPTVVLGCLDQPRLQIPAQAERALTRGWPVAPPSQPHHSA
ncbi:MAG TPA: hypothetical protein VHN80_26360 [Kineosporiaceae bacterium]|nr:hypothetical protein [Kineosporiaceae bacterium]